MCPPRRRLHDDQVFFFAYGPEQATAFEREVLLLHFDVDTVDFTDAPLSENTGRNEGLPLDIALRALAVLASAEHLSALTVTELNPLHGDEDGRTLERFVDGLAGCL
jgi:arginase